jgi:putative redox protein
MNVSASWHHGLRFSGKADNGIEIPIGTDQGEGGIPDGISPLELTAISLAGCTAMDVISILTKKKQEVTSFEVKVHAEQAADFPKVFTHMVITYLVTGHAVEEIAVVRAIELSETKYCPVQAMLGKVVPIEMLYEIFEADESGRGRLTKRGKYQSRGV